MEIQPTAAKKPPKKADPRDNWKDQPRFDNGQFKPKDYPNFLQRGVAGTLRSIGVGAGRAGVASAAIGDQLYIGPTEAVMGASTLARQTTAGVPVVGKVVGKAATGVTFLTAFNNLIFGMLVRQPSDFVAGATHALADSIDGKKTYNGSLGGLMLDGTDAMSMAILAAQEGR
jgi:hypothetical protein